VHGQGHRDSRLINRCHVCFSSIQRPNPAARSRYRP
jgi:hypothetical protein